MTKADNLYYSAEAAAGIGFLAACPSLEDASRFVAFHTSKPWWRALCPGDPEIGLVYIPRVQFSGTTRERGKFVISIALNRLHEGIIAHELAHVPTFHSDTEHSDHNAAFARAHLEILKHTTDGILVARFKHELQARGILPED